MMFWGNNFEQKQWASVWLMDMINVEQITMIIRQQLQITRSDQNIPNLTKTETVADVNEWWIISSAPQLWRTL